MVLFGSALRGDTGIRRRDPLEISLRVIGRGRGSHDRVSRDRGGIVHGVIRGGRRGDECIRIF